MNALNDQFLDFALSPQRYVANSNGSQDLMVNGYPTVEKAVQNSQTSSFGVVSTERLNEIAKCRWFKTQEIYTILTNATISNLKECITSSLPQKPPSGSWFLLDEGKLKKRWKQDGHRYRPRKNGSGFQEDSEVLRYCDIEIKCLYSYIIDDPLQLDQSNGNKRRFNRRIYKLMNKTISDPNQLFPVELIFVHYLIENMESPQSIEEESPKGLQDVPLCENPQYPGTIIEKQGGNKQNHPGSDLMYQSTPDVFNNDDLSNRKEDAIFESPFRFESIWSSFQEDRKEELSQGPTLSNQATQKFVPIEDYTKLQSLVENLEKRLRILEECPSTQGNQLQKEDQPVEIDGSIGIGHDVFPVHPSITVPSENPVIFEIIDFSPEWDYTNGGSKVIICYKLRQHFSEMFVDENGFVVTFDKTSVAGIVLQPGVLKCIVPPHFPGFVKLEISYKNQPAIFLEANQLFEYRKLPSKKQKKKICEMDPKKGGQTYEHEFKVRIIENLDSLNNLFESNNNNPSFQEFYKHMSTIIQDCRTNIQECDENVIIKLLTTFTDQEIVDILIYMGSISKNKIEEVMKQMFEEEENDEHTERNLGTLTRTRNILDTLLREVTLCDSITSSEHYSRIGDMNDAEASSYISLEELMLKDLEDAIEACGSEKKRKSGMRKSGHEISEHDAEKRPEIKRRYLKRRGPTQHFQTQSQSELPSDPQFQEHVTTIQKNVRGWLLRRQYLDMKYATRVLQNYIRSRLARKHLHQEANEIIQNKVKTWLNIK